MRLLGYYAFHSFINVIRKLCRTWVLILILVCFLFGIGIGLGASLLSDVAEEEEPSQEEVILPEDGEDELTAEQKEQLSGLIIGGTVLGILALGLLLDNGKKAIFLPGDVQLLFTAPMKPQAVLLFRLVGGMGSMVLAGTYFGFNFGGTIHSLTGQSVLPFVLAIFLTMAFLAVAQMTIYVFSFSNSFFRKWLRKLFLALIMLAAIGFSLYFQSSGLDILTAASRFFNGRISNFIPVWGWLKGFAYLSSVGETGAALLCLGAQLAFSAVLVVLVWRQQPDFYEDAMQKAEELAGVQRSMRDKNGNGSDIAIAVSKEEENGSDEDENTAKKGRIFRKKKKNRNRGEDVLRDGLNRGFGADVFFYKSFYNRKRFARFGFLTKTMEFYFVVLAGMSIIGRFILQMESFSLVPMVLAGLAFFRSLGNPIRDDTQKLFFETIPESSAAKLFWSLLAGVGDCALDILPGYLLAVILIKPGVFEAIGWYILVISVEAFSGTVGCFIDISVRVSSAEAKQVVQILFIYFGLLPDAALIAVGMVFHILPLMLPATILFNLSASAIFLYLASVSMGRR